MKVKLLKKVRKRFSIIHMPNGFVTDFDGEHYDYNLFKLTDAKDSFGYRTRYAQLGKSDGHRQFCDGIFDTEKECIEYLKSIIIVRLRGEGYKQRKDQSIKLKEKKVWFI